MDTKAAYGEIVKYVVSSDPDAPDDRPDLFLLSGEDFEKYYDEKVRAREELSSAVISSQDALKMAREVIITQRKEMKEALPLWADQHYKDTIVKGLDPERKWASLPDWDNEYQ